jgi:hypothetical protein
MYSDNIVPKQADLTSTYGGWVEWYYMQSNGEPIKTAPPPIGPPKDQCTNDVPECPK